MNTCCPNCTSDAAVGTDLISACTECASVSVAGGSMSMALMTGLGAGVIGMFYLARTLTRSGGLRLTARRAVA